MVVRPSYLLETKAQNERTSRYPGRTSHQGSRPINAPVNFSTAGLGGALRRRQGVVRTGRFWSGTDDIGRHWSVHLPGGNTAEATQPQLHPGVCAGQWLPPPSTVGTWAGGFFQLPREQLGLMLVSVPHSGLDHLLTWPLRSCTTLPSTHLCGIAGIWKGSEDSFGAWKGLIQ